MTDALDQLQVLDIASDWSKSVGLGLRNRAWSGSAELNRDASLSCVPTLDQALGALSAPALTLPEVERSPSLASPGLYAVSGGLSVWSELGLGEPPDDRPLYVGKCEGSFQSRDLEDHFGDGRTGRSTLRRSFAALLAADLRLTPVPRGKNPLDRTKRATMYGLRPEDDARLTAWMRKNLALALWPCRDIIAVCRLEAEVIKVLKPPLCIDGTWGPNHWHAETIEPARRTMTAIVRSTLAG